MDLCGAGDEAYGRDDGVCVVQPGWGGCGCFGETGVDGAMGVCWAGGNGAPSMGDLWVADGAGRQGTALLLEVFGCYARFRWRRHPGWDGGGLFRDKPDEGGHGGEHDRRLAQNLSLWDGRDNRGCGWRWLAGWVGGLEWTGPVFGGGGKRRDGGFGWGRRIERAGVGLWHESRRCGF